MPMYSSLNFAFDRFCSSDTNLSDSFTIFLASGVLNVVFHCSAKIKTNHTTGNENIFSNLKSLFVF